MSTDLRPFLDDSRVVDRFHAKVDKGEPDECWPWLGTRKPPYGYGQFVLRKGLFVTASRFALALKVGQPSRGIQACHTCDNPPCCNPDHLFAGSQLENNLDCIGKGRGNRSRGESHRNARLTDELVMQLRKIPCNNANLKEWAAAHGISTHTAYMAHTGRTWKHVGVAA